MATKAKAPAKTGKRRKTGGFVKKTVKRRGGRRKGLSEIFTPAGFMAAGKNTLMGAAGGATATFVDKQFLTGQSGLVRFGSHVALSVLAWAIGQPAAGAGVAGAAAALMMQDMGLGENGGWADPNALNQLPVFLDENGKEFYLSEDGQAFYLDEAGNPYLLSEDGQAIYPSYNMNYAFQA